MIFAKIQGALQKGSKEQEEEQGLGVLDDAETFLYKIPFQKAD